jgi:hypothetical protein
MTEILVQAATGEQVPPGSRVIDHPAWPVLKDAVERIRPWQSKDGSIDFTAEGAPERAEAEAAVREVVGAVEQLSPLLPHDAEYHRELVKDLTRWAEGGFEVPDFLDSLLAFQPAAHRVDGLQHLVVFPMYTQNGNPDRNLEAVVFRMVWPDWLAELERTRFDNPLFCGITFEDFTGGYDTNSAVLFPETVAVREAPERFTWGAIFCDREAARFRRVTEAAVDVLGVDLPEDIAAMVHDQKRCQEAFVLWDLIHDRAHSHGDLPFDPFMIKQRQPFWMYGLEELRCDLTAFKEAVKLEAEGVPQARDVQSRSCSTACSASRSPVNGCATTTAWAASCSSPTSTSTTSCAGPTTPCASTGSAPPRSPTSSAPRSRSSTATASTGPSWSTGSPATSWSPPTSPRTRPPSGPRAPTPSTSPSRPASSWTTCFRTSFR